MDGDTLHPNRDGADKLAELVASQIEFAAIASAEPVTEPTSEPTIGVQTISGDVNTDGQFNVSDVVLLQKWLLAVPDIHLADWKAADLCEDDRLNVFDLCLMKRTLVSIGNRYLAINAAVNNGVSENTNTGSSTGTYINLNNEVGSSIAWTIDVPENDNYKLTFHNANGGTADRDMRLSLSGTDDKWTVSFPTIGGWTNWADSSIIVPLSNGTQTVTLTSLMTDGGSNLDYMTFEKTNSDAQQPYVQPAITEGAKQVEALTRRVVAANTGNGMFLSWRSLATDSANTTFKLYKNGILLKGVRYGGKRPIFIPWRHTRTGQSSISLRSRLSSATRTAGRAVRTLTSPSMCLPSERRRTARPAPILRMMQVSVMWTVMASMRYSSSGIPPTPRTIRRTAIRATSSLTAIS